MITIVDYGVGNTASLINMCDYLGVVAEVSGDAHAIARADSLVLPGVGAFDKAMDALRSRGLIEALNEAVLVRKVPVLGVCLGMQLLGRSSEEGQATGLGWIDADAKKLAPPAGANMRIPHMGWAEVRPLRNTPLFAVRAEAERFYFAHSYFMMCDRGTDVAAVVDYGGELCCAIDKENIHGVQFHPEKSHRFGMRLLQAFSTLTPTRNP